MEREAKGGPSTSFEREREQEKERKRGAGEGDMRDARCEMRGVVTSKNRPRTDSSIVVSSVDTI